MSRISWDALGTRGFQTGVDRGVLYIDPTSGIPWSGLISVEEGVSGGEEASYYQDGIKQAGRVLSENFEATIKAYTVPTDFYACDGTASLNNGLFIGEQPRVPFNLSYRTLIGNDLLGVSAGYKLHLVYNALALPTTKEFATLSRDSNVTQFSWKITTTPSIVSGRRASAHLTIDSTTTNPYLLADFEDILYGTEDTDPQILSLQEVINYFSSYDTIIVTDNGDGSFTVEGPDDVVYYRNATEFEINWRTAVPIDSTSYTVGSG